MCEVRDRSLVGGNNDRMMFCYRDKEIWWWVCLPIVVGPSLRITKRCREDLPQLLRC